MKKIFYLICFNLLISLSVFAQLKDGDIAPNWTLTDLNGIVHTLYNYLDEGKFVIIDFSDIILVVQ